MGVCLLTVMALAEITPDKSPAEILATALRNKTRLTYKLTTVKNDPQLYLKTMEYYYNQANPNGTNNTRCEEQATEGGVPGGDKFVIINNSEGTFRIHSGNVYKLGFEEVEKGFAFKDMPTQGESAEYKMAEDTVAGNSCYKITKRVKPDWAAFENYKKFLPQWYVRKNQNSLRAECKEHFPVVQVYYIDKKKLLPWKYEFYNITGGKIFTQEYQKMELLSKIDPELFTIAQNVSVLNYDNPDNYSKDCNKAVIQIVKENIKTKSLETIKKEYRKAEENAMQVNRPGIISGVGSYIDSNFSSITSILSVILFWFSVALFAFVGIYKFRMRKSAK